MERDFVFDSVPRPASSPPATPRAASVDAALDEEHPPITLAHLCDMLATAVHERTSTAARMVRVLTCSQTSCQAKRRPSVVPHFHPAPPTLSLPYP